jgi:hypothetical protein
MRIAFIFLDGWMLLLLPIGQTWPSTMAMDTNKGAESSIKPLHISY